MNYIDLSEILNGRGRWLQIKQSLFIVQKLGSRKWVITDAKEEPAHFACSQSQGYWDILLWIGIEAGTNNLNILPGLALHARNAEPEDSNHFATSSSQ